MFIVECYVFNGATEPQQSHKKNHYMQLFSNLIVPLLLNVYSLFGNIINEISELYFHA